MRTDIRDISVALLLSKDWRHLLQKTWHLFRFNGVNLTCAILVISSLRIGNQ